MKKPNKIKFNKKFIPVILFMIMLIGIAYAGYVFRYQVNGNYTGANLKVDTNIITPLEDLYIKKENRMDALNREKTLTTTINGEEYEYANNEFLVTIKGHRLKNEKEYIYFNLVNDITEYNRGYYMFDAYLIDLDTGKEKQVIQNSHTCDSRHVQVEIDSGEDEYNYLLKLVLWGDIKFKSKLTINSATTSNFYINISTRQTESIQKIDFARYNPKEIYFISYDEYSSLQTDSNSNFFSTSAYQFDGSQSYNCDIGYFTVAPNIIYVRYHYQYYGKIYGMQTDTKELNGLFKDCKELVKVDFGDFFISTKAVSMESMFEGCTSLEYVNLDFLDTAEVRNMDRMFYGCENLKIIDLTKNYSFKLESAESMFEGCSKLVTILTNGFDISKAKGENTFAGCTSLIGNKFQTIFNSNNISSNYGTEDYYFTRVTPDDGNTYSFTNNIPSPTSTNSELKSYIQSSTINNIKNIYFMRMSEEDLSTSFTTISANLKVKVVNGNTLIVASPGTTILPTSLAYFLSFPNLDNVYFENVSTENSTDMKYMFYNTKISFLDIDSFDTSNVTSFEGFLKDCENLKNISFSQIDTRKVISMESMFDGCENIEFLDLIRFDTLNVTNMSRMFADCKKLIFILNPRFYTDNVTDFSEMFLNTNKMINYNFRDWIFKPTNMFNFITKENALNKKITLIIEDSDFTNVIDCDSVQDFFDFDLSTAYIFSLEGTKFSDSVTSFYNNKTVVGDDGNYLFGKELSYFSLANTELNGVTSFENISYGSLNIITVDFKGLQLGSTTSFKNIIKGFTGNNYSSYFDFIDLNIPNATLIGNIVVGNLYKSTIYLSINTTKNWTLYGKLINQTNKGNSNYQTASLLKLYNIDFSKCNTTSNALTTYIDANIYGNSSSKYNIHYKLYEGSGTYSTGQTNYSEPEFYQGTFYASNVNFGNISSLNMEDYYLTNSSSYPKSFIITNCDISNLTEITFGNRYLYFLAIENSKAPKLENILSVKTDAMVGMSISGLDAPKLSNINSNPGFTNFFSQYKIRMIDFSYARLDSIKNMNSIINTSPSYQTSSVRINFEGVYFKSLETAERMLCGVSEAYINQAIPNSNYNTSFGNYIYYLNFKNAHFEGENFSMRAAFAKVGLGSTRLKNISFDNMYIKGVNNLSYAFFYVNNSSGPEFKFNNVKIIGNNLNLYRMFESINFGNISMKNLTIKGISNAEEFMDRYNDSSYETYENLYIDNLYMEGENFNANKLFAGKKYFKYNIYANNIKIVGASSIDYMFQGCKFKELTNLSNIDLSTVTSLEYMFDKAYIESPIVFRNVKFPSNLSRLFANANYVDIYLTDSNTNYTLNDRTIYAINCDFSGVTIMDEMFLGANVSAINSINIDIARTSLKSASGMFKGEQSTTPLTVSEINIENLDCSQLENMSNFLKYSNIQSFDSTGMNNLYNVKDLSNAFAYTKLNELTLSNLTSETIENMDYIFYESNDLSTLNLGSFNPKNILSYKKLFKYSSSKLSIISVESMELDWIEKLNFVLENKFNDATVDTGAYANKKPYIIVKNSTIKTDLLGKYSYLVSDQIIINNIVTVSAPSEHLIRLDNPSTKTITLRIFGNGPELTSQTISLTEINKDTTKLYSENITIDYDNRIISIPINTTNIEGITTQTLQFNLNNGEKTITIQLNVESKSCVFTVAKNVGSNGTSFTLDSNGYYVSNNHYDSTYNLMTINYSCASVSKINVDYSINSEKNYDIGFIGVGGTLSSSSNSDSSYLFRTYGLASSNGVLYTGRYSYNLTSQTGSLDFKYRKDGSGSYGTDDFKFKLSYE